MYRSFHFSFRSFVSSVLSFSSPFQYIRCTVSQCVIVAALFPKPPPSSPENPTCVYKQAVLWYYVAGAACTRMLLHRCTERIVATYKVTFHALFPDAGPARTTNAAGVPLIYKRKGRDRVASPDYFRIIPINTECKRSAFLAETRLALVWIILIAYNDFFSFFAVNVFFIRLNFEIIVGGGWDWFFEKSGEPQNKKDWEIGL